MIFDEKQENKYGKVENNQIITSTTIAHDRAPLSDASGENLGRTDIFFLLANNAENLIIIRFKICLSALKIIENSICILQINELLEL